MKKLIALSLVLSASPAFAATGPFFSLRNTDFVVLIAFLIFVGVLVYLKVPGKLMGMLDKRATGIKSELEEARALREEAQTLLASYERKQKEVQEQADRIVAAAKEEAKTAAEEAREDLKKSIARRIAAAEGQIASAEASAVKEVRDQAVTIAVQAARDVIAKQMTAAEGNKLIDDAISQVDAKLH
ncbi:MULTISPECIES: F0F1 ATP synthase subunit B [Roseobacteraceae]|uniref:ATP synthase subunit b n=1 Tax=Pseudosulfitobacter pseudonitzschiae TaxID=1402135 RepID=A0A221K3S6_9RHOB|nr:MULTISPECIES: F0F1 ATP synthase subunit B [Roseobacteraceae]ASM73497.1 ATP synthase subunit b [Pseudosulfitobacter pseudonitzschiae]